MSEAFIPDPRFLRTPRLHGQVLFNPSRQAAERYLAHHQKITSRLLPVEALRRQARADLLAAAGEFAALTGLAVSPALEPEKPWILTGHQVEFYHSGVWAKVLAADALAQRVGGAAIDLLVDYDSVDHLGIAVPWRDAELYQRSWVELPPGEAGLPAEFLPVPPRQERIAWAEAIFRLCGYSDAGPAPLRAFLAPFCQEGPACFPALMSQARGGLERSLGLDVTHVPASGLCRRPGFLAFFLAWLRQAPAMGQRYNRHLGLYRQRAGISNPAFPMPDLKPGEVPFWQLRPGQRRERLTFDAQSGLLAGELPIADLLSGEPLEMAPRLAERLAKTGWGIRPRALTLTSFVRLALADLFIHGLGGALYDQVTDGFLAELVSPLPGYTCVSAAWLLPLAPVAAEPPESLETLVMQRHHAAHNPPEKVDPDLLARRGEILSELANRPPTRSQRRAQRPRRLELFGQLHAILDQMHAQAGDLQRLDQRIAAKRLALAQGQITQRRDYFFALHSRPSLLELRRRLAEA